MKKILVLSTVFLTLFVLSWTGIFIGAESLNDIQLGLLREMKNITLIFSVLGFFVYASLAIFASIWES